MSVVPALIGSPRSINHEGITYSIGLITAKVRAEYERKFSERARERINRAKSTLSRKEYLDELRMLGEREDRGEFSFLGEAGLTTALTTPWGQRTLLQLLMVDTATDVVDKLLEEKSDEVLWLLQRVVKESMPLMAKGAEATTDPFVQAEQESSPTS